MGADAGEDLREVRALRTQVEKGPGGQDPVGVEAGKVVPGGVKLSRLDQLQGQQPDESKLDLHALSDSATLQCDLGQVTRPPGASGSHED